MILNDLFEDDPAGRASLQEAAKIAFARMGRKIVRVYHREPSPVDGTPAEARKALEPKRRFVARRVRAITADRVADHHTPVDRSPLSLRVQRQHQERN